MQPLTPRARALALLPFLFAFAAPAHAQASRTALVARLDSLAGAPVQEGRAVGISVAVVQGRDTLLLRGYGMANVELDVPTPPRAVYEIGSVTKQFTAAAILQLRDEGRLSLDDDLTTYLPDYPTGGRSIPIRRLLDHTSGIRGITEIATFGDLQHRGWPRDSAIALIARQPFDFEPGQAMIYNNSAFVLLGHVVEKASGMSYEQYVEERIFDRLGMADSRYCDNSEIVKGRTSGYGYAGTTLRRAPLNDHTWPFSAGSLCSTAGDMVTWLHALHGLHGERVLSEQSYRDMTAPSRLADGTPLRYGMALAVGPGARGAMQIGHGGAIAGFHSYAGWYPDAQLAVVVLINSVGRVSAQALANELAAEIIPPVPTSQRTWTGDATPLIGRYTGPARGRPMTVEITQNQGALMASVNGAAAQPLPWIDGWTFGRTSANILTFERVGTTTGPATLLRFDAGGGYYMLERATPSAAAASATARVLPGIDVVAAGNVGVLRGRRVGLITNHTGRTIAGESSIDVLHRLTDVDLVALFAPEHGLRGTADAGERVVDGVDEKTGLPVYSLYGDTRQPTREMLQGIDALVFDIQDIGTRYYTYVWTMALAMQSAAEHGVDFVVLDRPNPIGGTHVQGNVLHPDYATFVGLHPVPMRHGMTAGELARLVNAEFGVNARLHVVPVQGWRRAMWYDDTQLPWLPPSPNMPDLESATHYPGTCLFEGTNLSVARGTPIAFQQIGAPWLNNEEIVRRLNARRLPGVRFDAVTFTPQNAGDRKFNDQAVRGIRFITTDRATYDPTIAAIALLVEIQRLHADQLTFGVAHFDRLAGTDRVRQQILAGADVPDITATWREQIERFDTMRRRYLLYDPASR